QDTGVLRQRLGDLHHLLLGDAEAVHRQARVDVETDALQHAARLDIDAPAIDGAGNAPGKLPAQKDVLGDVEIGDEGEVLEDDGDAEPARIRGRGDLDRLPSVQEGACLRTVGAEQHLHQRRFAGAVL